MLWPETELDGPDPMLDELRAIRDDISAAVMDLPADQLVLWYHQQAQKAAEMMECVLVPHPTVPRAMQLIRKSDKAR